MPQLENENGFLEQVRQLISENLSDSCFGVTELADAISMHRCSFSRKLSERTGKSPSQLIEAMRMEKARHLLISTDMPIAGIASAIGFTELSNFSRAFKRYQGGCPSNIRNSAVSGEISAEDATN